MRSNPVLAAYKIRYVLSFETKWGPWRLQLKSHIWMLLTPTSAPYFTAEEAFRLTSMILVMQLMRRWHGRAFLWEGRQTNETLNSEWENWFPPRTRKHAHPFVSTQLLFWSSGRGSGRRGDWTAAFGWPFLLSFPSFLWNMAGVLLLFIRKFLWCVPTNSCLFFKWRERVTPHVIMAEEM